MSKDSGQITKRPKQFKLGHLGTLNQVIVALGKTIRAMADGSVDSQVGSRIANGLGIMRQCLETRTLDQLGERLDQIESTGGTSYGTTNTITDSRRALRTWRNGALPRRGPLIIVGADEAECRKRLEEIEAAGQRPAHVRFLMTGVPRSDRYRSG